MRIKRWIAGLLCICMIGTTDAMTLHAASLGSMSTQAEESNEGEGNQEETSQEETTQDDATQKDTVQEENDSTPKDEITEQEEVIEDEEQTLKETNEETENEKTEKEEQTVDKTGEETLQTQEDSPLISYAVIDQPYITTPGTQKVVVGIGEDDTVIERAILTYKNRTTKEEMQVEAEQILGNAALFTMEFADESKSGIYELSSVTYTVAQIEHTTAFSDAGMEMVFGVNEQAESNPDGVVVEEENIDIDVVTIDENGNTTSQNNIQEAIEEVQQERDGLNKMTRTYGAANGNIVVLLDPGHDANHPGAAYNGLVEKDINLKIAQYCKIELETYAGVSVYMTREGDACPYSVSDAGTCNLRRVEYAKNIGAAIYVSIHNNASGVNATGAEVYYPNQNYNAYVSAMGQDTAQKILNKLVELGLKNRGIKIRNSETGTLYPNGTLADYYGVIKNCKYAGIPAIIVEHAFMDSSDAANFLNSDEKLQKLGIADATGIAQHFGLKKKSSGPPPPKPGQTTITSIRSYGNTTLKLNWGKVVGASGYEIYRSSKKDGSYSKIATIANGNTQAYSDKKITPGKYYYYKIRVRATLGSQNSYSDYSAVRAGKAVTNAVITSVKSTENTKLKVSWKKREGASGYYLYRSVTKSSGYKRIAVISSGSTTMYIDSGLKTGKTYYYKIKSCNKVAGITGYSSVSEPVLGKTIGSTSIKAVKAVNENLKITWNKKSGASGYYLYRSTSKSSGFKRIASLSNKTTSYTDKNVKVATTYYYRVRVCNNVNGYKGYGSSSATFSGRTVVTTNISSVVSRSSSKLQIKWDSVEGANGYYLYRSTSKDTGYERIAAISGGTKNNYTDSSLKTGKRYYYRIRTRNKVNGIPGYSNIGNTLSGKTVAKPKITSIEYNNSYVTVRWNEISGATGYYIRRATSENGEYTKIATVTPKTKLYYNDKSVVAGNTYYYRVQAINKVNGKTGYSGYCTPKSISGGTPIMGNSTVSLQQMVTYYNRSGKIYPAHIYAAKGAPDITTFCNIVIQEAAAEGIRADVVFAQVCNETGFLQFGGDVKPEQCNFAGLGATGGGVPGETFVDVRTGIRAQVQHLKAYACNEPLKLACVDNRFSYVTRGCAPYVEWLGIQENPYGKGWAAAKNYGYTLMNMVRTMQTM